MGAYKLTPCSISDSSAEISSVEARIFNLYQNMIAAEKEDEEKTLLDLLNKVEEELYEEKITEFTSIFNPNKLSGDET